MHYLRKNLATLCPYRLIRDRVAPPPSSEWTTANADRPLRTESEQVSKSVPCPTLRRPSYVCTVWHVGTRNTTSYTVWKNHFVFDWKLELSLWDRKKCCYVVALDDGGKYAESLRFEMESGSVFLHNDASEVLCTQSPRGYRGSVMPVPRCLCASNILPAWQPSSLPPAGVFQDLTHRMCCSIPVVKTVTARAPL